MRCSGFSASQALGGVKLLSGADLPGHVKTSLAQVVNSVVSSSSASGFGGVMHSQKLQSCKAFILSCNFCHVH